jgi:flagellar basal body-associated protein FliL
MNLLAIILVAMALIVGACVFYVAWELSSGEHEPGKKKEPGETKESKGSPGS